MQVVREGGREVFLEGGKSGKGVSAMPPDEEDVPAGGGHNGGDGGDGVDGGRSVKEEEGGAVEGEGEREDDGDGDRRRDRDGAAGGDAGDEDGDGRGEGVRRA